MAGWNDLPVELHAKIVRQLDPKGQIAKGQDRISAEYHALWSLWSLRLVDTVLSALANEIVWQTVKFHRPAHMFPTPVENIFLHEACDMMNSRKVKELERPLCPVAPSRLGLVRTLDFAHTHDTEYASRRRPPAEAMDLALATPAFSKLRLISTEGWTQLVRALPQSRRAQITALELTGLSPRPAEFILPLLALLPQVEELSLEYIGVEPQQQPSFAAALGKLHSLRRLALGLVTSGFDEPSSILLSIKSPLTHLAIHDLFALCPLRTLLEHFGPGLQSLTLSIYFWGDPTSPLFTTPLLLPHLQSLALLDNGNIISPRSLIAAFDEAPLRSLHFAITFSAGGENEMTESVWSKMKSRAGSLKELRLSLTSNGKKAEALGELNGRCAEAGILLEVDWKV